jgi:hypothetical protein
MRNVWKLILASTIIVMVGCSEKKPDAAKEPVVQPQVVHELQPPDSTGIRPPDWVWGVESHPLIKFNYQPTDSLRFYAADLLKKAVEIYQFDCQVLNWTAPEPVEFYCYQDIPTLTAYTTSQEPFVLGNRIYYGYGPSFGRPFAEFVIARVPGGPSQFDFMKEGLPFLLDYSGRNYHHATNNFLSEGTIDPLASLMDNGSYQSLRAVPRQIESASLVAYIMWEWGYEKFLKIYHSKADFSVALKEATGLTVDQLENQWHLFLPEHTVEKEEARQGASN